MADDIRALTFRQLRAANVSRVIRWHPPESEPWTLADWSNAMMGEVGELAEAHLGLGDAIQSELADVVIYADLLAFELGGDLALFPEQSFEELQASVSSDALPLLVVAAAGKAADVVKKIRRIQTEAGLAPGSPSVEVLTGRALSHLQLLVIFAARYANAHRLDLTDAVVTKFNVVSGRQGFPEMLG